MNNESHPDFHAVYTAMTTVSPHLAEAFALDLSQFHPAHRSNVGDEPLDPVPEKADQLREQMVLLVTKSLMLADRVRDAVEYAFMKGCYVMAARLLSLTDDAMAATRIMTRFSTLLEEPSRYITLAEIIAKHSKDDIWAVILFLLGGNPVRALQIAQRNAPRMTKQKGECVPSLVELALWRIARDFMSQHPKLRSVAAVDALAALRTHMINDLFDRLVLPLCVLWYAEDRWRLRHNYVDVTVVESPIAQAYLIGSKFFATNVTFYSADRAILAKSRLLYPLLHMFTMSLNVSTPKIAPSECLRFVDGFFDAHDLMFVSLVKDILTAHPHPLDSNNLPLLELMPTAVLHVMLTRKVRV